jgi:hypothetical protein
MTSKNDPSVEDLKPHPFAEMFPLMNAEELQSLAADIAANGLRQKGVKYQGMVLDGRNRQAACLKAGVEMEFEEFTGDDAAALALVVSLNSQRRDLEPGQRAVVAAKAWGLNGYSKGGRPDKKKLLETPTISIRQVARQFKVSEKPIMQARDLLAEAPDLARKVEMRKISLNEAYKELVRRREQAAQKDRDAELTAKYQEAIIDGKMNPEAADKALARAQAEEEEEQKRVEGDAALLGKWFSDLAGVQRWLIIFVRRRSDGHLARVDQPGAPGFRDYGITRASLRAAAADLERLATVAVKDPTEDRNQGDGRGAGPEASESPGTQGAGQGAGPEASESPGNQDDGRGAGPEASESPGGPKESQPRRREEAPPTEQAKEAKRRKKKAGQNNKEVNRRLREYAEELYGSR